MLREGRQAPDFELASSEGQDVSLRDLRGKTVVLYFYPKDDTPGCTKEACAFRDAQGCASTATPSRFSPRSSSSWTCRRRGAPHRIGVAGRIPAEALADAGA